MRSFDVRKGTSVGRPDGDTLNLKGKYHEESAEFMKKNGIKNLGIGRESKARDLNFLKHFGFIEGLLLDSDITDVDAIYQLPNLKFILLGHLVEKIQIDFTNFNKLEDCILTWNKINSSILDLNRLKKLSLYKYDGSNLSKFSNLNKLNELHFNQAKLIDFAGIDSLVNLKKLEVHYLRKLERISHLSGIAKSIQELRFNNSRKIVDHSSVSALQKLRALFFNACSPIKSLSFLEDLKLDTFGFVDTDIIDGDLTYCQGIPNVFFTDKKHFSHRFKDLNPNWPMVK